MAKKLWELKCKIVEVEENRNNKKQSREEAHSIKLVHTKDTN